MATARAPTNRYGYVAHGPWDTDLVHFDAVVKHDLETGTLQVHDYGAGTEAGEAGLRPRSRRHGRGRRLARELRVRPRHRDQRAASSSTPATWRASRWPASTCPAACRSASTATGCPTTRTERTRSATDAKLARPWTTCLRRTTAGRLHRDGPPHRVGHRRPTVDRHGPAAQRGSLHPYWQRDGELGPGLVGVDRHQSHARSSAPHLEAHPVPCR